MNVLSLFDGMSCGMIALQKAGIKVDNYFASEIDKYAIQVSKQNYPNIIQLGDITKWKEWNLPNIDLVIGGSPCQGFSFAGKNLNFEDPLSVLFFEFEEIVKSLTPKYFFLENVKMKKESMDVITERMGVDPILINSSLVSAQNRERLYWTNIPNVQQPVDNGILLDDILEKEVDVKYYLSEKANDRCINNKRSRAFKIGQKKSGALLSNQFKQSTDSLFANLGEGKYRRLTPLECERLQTVPENYSSCVSDSQRYKMLGNGWTIDVISHILGGLKNER